MLWIVHDGGSFRVLREENEACVRIDGVVGPEADEAGLVGALEAIHREFAGCARLQLDLRSVPHMSAVGLRAMLHWLKQIAGEDPPQRYRIVALSDPQHAWQRTSLRNLARLAGDTFEIEENAAS